MGTMTATETVLGLSWSTSKARDTYGYNIARLDDTTTGKRYRCMGGGYDMVGTVLADWLQDVHQDRLQGIGQQAYAVYGPTGERDTRKDGLYGMTLTPLGRVTVDGACGRPSVERIAKAIGLSVRTLTNGRGNAIGFVVTESE